MFRETKVHPSVFTARMWIPLSSHDQVYMHGLHTWTLVQTYSQCDPIEIKIQSQVNMLNIAKAAENTSIEGEINVGQVDDSPPETLSDGSNGDSVCQEENHNVINHSYRGDKQSE